MSVQLASGSYTRKVLAPPIRLATEIWPRWRLISVRLIDSRFNDAASPA